MATGNVTVRLNLNSTGYSAEMTKAQRQMQSLTSATAAMGHATRSSAMEASAAIRVMEGNITNNIRAAERFVATIPALAKFTHAIFPAVGAIAFASVLGEMAKRVADFVQKAEKAPQVIGNAFREMNLSAETSIDTLNLSTAKMQEQIDLLSGKHPNTLAEDLAEASLAADKLATSLDNDNRKIAEMLKANGLSALSGFLGKAGTADVAGSVNYFDQQLSDLGARHQHAVRTGDTAGAADLQKQLDDKRIAALNYANSQIAQRQQGQGPGSLNQDANLSVLTGYRNTLVDQQDDETATANNKATASQLKKLDDAKKYADAQKKEQAELLKVYEDQEKQQNAFNKLTTNEEIQFWSDRIAAFTKGGQQYIEVQDKINDLIAKRPDLFSENKKNQAQVGQSAVEGGDLLDRGQKALIDEPAIQQMERATRSNETFNAMVAKGAEAQAKSAAAYREASIAIGLQEGTLSKLGAAQALAKVHEDEHAAAIAAVNKELRDQLAIINGDTNLKGDDLARAQRNANQAAAGQTAQINSTYGATRQQDAASIYANTSAGEAADTYRTMLQNWSNMTQNITQAMTRAADSFNDDIAAAITGHGKKGDFGKTFSTLGESLVKASLQKGESALFGGGQLGASPNNPVWTRSANGAGVGTPGGPNLGPFIQPTFGPQGRAGGGGILGGILGKLFGGGGSGGGGEGGDSLSTMPGMLGGPGGAGGLPQLLLRGGVMDGFSMPGSAGLLTMPGLGLDTTGAGLSSVLGLGGDAGGAVGSAAAGLAGDAASMFGGFFAGGGDFLANRPMIVGEQGPEMLVPRTAGHIVPNHQLGGGSTTHNWNIDARGSTDPAAVAAAIHRAAPAIVAASVQANHHAAKRSPSGR